MTDAFCFSRASEGDILDVGVSPSQLALGKRLPSLDLQFSPLQRKVPVISTPWVTTASLRESAWPFPSIRLFWVNTRSLQPFDVDGAWSPPYDFLSGLQ